MPANQTPANYPKGCTSCHNAVMPAGCAIHIAKGGRQTRCERCMEALSLALSCVNDDLVVIEMYPSLGNVWGRKHNRKQMERH